LAKGDEITDFGMNIQPFLILATIASFLLGIPEALRQSWYISASILLLMLGYYVFSAVKLSVKFKDIAAMRLVVLYFVRALAWFTGAVITTVKFLTGGRK
jgi:hypothetical protein